MAQPALVRVSDLAAWVGEDIADGDLRAQAVLSAASTRVRGHVDATAAAGWVVTDGTVPDDVAMVVVQVAARIWVNPEGVQSDSIDDGSRRFANAGESGAYLTRGERDILSAYRVKPKGLWSLGTTRGDLNDTDQYLDVVGSEQIPFMPGDA